MLDLLHETLRSLRAHALRFTLTSLGVAWGAFMLTYLSSSIEGVLRHFERELTEMGPKLVFVGGGSVAKERVGERGARPVELENVDVERVTAIADVEHATGEIQLWSRIVRGAGRTRLLKIEGVDAIAGHIRNLATQRGRFLSPTDVARGARVAVIGPGSAERLFGHLDVVGRSLTIESLRFRIIGVSIEKGAQLMNSGDLDDLKLWIPITTAQRWFETDDRVHRILMAPRGDDLGAHALVRAKESLGRHHDFEPDNATALWHFDIQEILKPIRGALMAFRVFAVFAGLTTLLVGAVGVMNIMLVVVGERQREIGLRKAVGASSKRIFLQFLAEATAVSVTAASFGSAAGVGLAMLISRIAPDGTPILSVPIYDPVTTLSIAVALVLVGIIAGVAPAIRAAQTEPAIALRRL